MIKEFKSGDGCRFMCTCLPGSTSLFSLLTAFSYKSFDAAGVSSPRPINSAASEFRPVAIKRDVILISCRSIKN